MSACVMTDLWGELVLLKVWGGKDSRSGGQRTVAAGQEQVSLALAEIEKRRRQRGYIEIAVRGAARGTTLPHAPASLNAP
jgi:hypothetical protein